MKQVFVLGAALVALAIIVSVGAVTGAKPENPRPKDP